MPASLSAADHRQMAEYHENAAALLSGVDVPGWEAVVLFYSALHFVQEAIILDPIWYEVERLASIDLRLNPSHRSVDRHRGYTRRDNTHTFGMNDLVPLLYPDISNAYFSLYQVSVAVRYGKQSWRPSWLPLLRTAREHIAERARMNLLRA